jgi:hypothetical protein
VKDPSANDPKVPAYASLSVQSDAPLLWAGLSLDSRALQVAAPGSTNRIAACWPASVSLLFQVPLNDNRFHQVALYALDWDLTGRVQRVDVLDAATGLLLDSRALSQFQNGVYAVWNVKGGVQFRVTTIGPGAAAVSGLFFDPVGTGSLLRADNATGGGWVGNYGSGGYSLAGYPAAPAASNPVATPGSSLFVPVTLPLFASSGSLLTWANPTADNRAPQDPGGSPNRVAACWTSGQELDLAVNPTDGLTHALAVYMVDFDGLGLSQQVRLLDPATGNTLDSQAVSDFQGGVYLVWQISARAVVSLIPTGPGGAVASGVFLD